MSDLWLPTGAVRVICDEPDCDGGFHECHDCGGDGWVLGDCFEDCCCCADPESEHDFLKCDICDGAGGWPCPAVPAEHDVLEGECP